jgi:hypothetical protein
MSRHTRHSLSLATFPIIAALYGQHFYAPEGEGGGAGGRTATDDKSKAKAAEGKKFEFTEEELNTKMGSAVKEAIEKERAEYAAKTKKEKDDADKAAATKQGEFQKLYDGEVAETKKLREELKAEKEKNFHAAVALRLNRYLADKHPDYVNAADTIFAAMKVDPDAKESDVDKTIKAAVDDFVGKFKPASAGGSGAPSGGVRGKAPSNMQIPPVKNDGQPPQRKMYGTIINSGF